ncbi:hypothetical protein GCM10010345_79850 [Streptomyces canarius]|uniref:ABC transporter ATP-binding protein n=1 Tax=Streptomyces canarius TaxID=285453 RepID=A0ABQ3D8J0_9ACTN|nr:hypothetical protein GCM10010345_79850 [Streptomyces canarius]
MLELFDVLQAQGMTLVVVTHDDAVGARASRRVRIHAGRLRQEEA